ncbi:glycosyltransferase [Massilia sp. NR 4-1]|uniref:glycosyltransferase n=1 Tax=Massilia sp. NR 4-1 TaxID=1678028 RepID=UPI00067BD7A7|nr:glycosyltransferase [Massilia sp. NR 4-1]AKU23035.1 glycosyl transferase family 1 [Massilia sp. NR 4-1]
MARILFIHQNFPGQFRHIAPSLAAEGHEVLALGMNAKADALPGVRYICHRVRNAGHATENSLLSDLHSKLLRGDSASAELWRLKEEGFAPDIVFVHPGWGEAMFVKDVFPTAKTIIYAEYYYQSEGGDSHFDPEFSKPPSLQSLQKLRIRNTHLLHAMSAADAALSPTQFQRDRHPAWFRDRISVIHDGIDTERFRPDAKAVVRLASQAIALRPGDEVVTYVARQLEPYRGYHTFMRALPLLQKLRPTARIVIVGGDGASYGAAAPRGKTWKGIFRDEVAAELDMRRIHFVGKLPHAVLTQLMQVSAVYTYLTYPFVLSWSLLEAMSTGCLIVGSRTAPLEEVIAHGRNGLLTDFFDAEQLAHTIASALAKRDSLTELRRAARRTVADRYDLHKICLPAQKRFILD